jgi:putative glycosyltransferase (TIGR04372 family)
MPTVGERQFKVNLCRHVIKPPAKAALRLFAMAVFAGLRALRPLVKVRIGVLHRYESIGHLSWNPELYLRRRARRESGHREWHLFATGKPANRQLIRMIKRRMFLVESRFLVKVFGAVSGQAIAADCWVDLRAEWNTYDDVNEIPTQISFTLGEERKGRELLERVGIEPGSSFICFHARDGKYIAATHLEDRLFDEPSAYRNCSISNYLPAAEYLTSQGLYALRMGAIVEEAIESTNGKLIDYASGFRTDFGDIFLLAKCKFFLGASSGILGPAMMFGVPTAIANMIPMYHAMPGKKDLFILKKLWHIAEKRFLTFPEIVERGADAWVGTHWYKEAGIEFIENTADEVLDLAKEMNARLDGVWVTTEEDDYLQQRYRDLFPPGHFCHGFPSRIGAQFLRDNTELLGF